jgi:type VI protein secretion system component Hcp
MADDQKFFFLDMTNAGVPNGGSERPDTKNWLELDSWNFSMSQSADPNVKGGRPTSTSAQGRFSFSIKHNGPALFRGVTNSTLQTQPITFRAYRGGMDNGGAVGSPTMCYFELVFNDALVGSRQLHGDDGQKSENIELVFNKVKMTYWQIVNGKRVSAGLTKQYDAKSNMAS